MKNILKISFILTLLFLTINVFAQESDKTVEITTTGIGKTESEAKDNAIRSALEQAFGAFISSKTEMLNDKIVSEQMSSVTSGNIQSYDIVNKTKLPDSSIFITIKSIVSVSKLISFVESKGGIIEYKGALFTINIKQQILNEQNEFEVLYETIGILHNLMQTAIDYKIEAGTPQSKNGSSDNWELGVKVYEIANPNLKLCFNLLNETLKRISINQNDLENYKSLKLNYYQVNINSLNYFIRNQSSMDLLKSFYKLFGVYYANFEVESIKNIQHFNRLNFPQEVYFQSNDEQIYIGIKKITIKYNTDNETIGVIEFKDEFSLSQLEKFTGYKIYPKSQKFLQYTNGGYLFEKNEQHGKVFTLISFKNLNFYDANQLCLKLKLGGYSDWRLASINELELIQSTLDKSLGDSYSWFNDYEFWSSELHLEYNPDENVNTLKDFLKTYKNKTNQCSFIAVREF